MKAENGGGEGLGDEIQESEKKQDKNQKINDTRLRNPSPPSL